VIVDDDLLPVKDEEGDHHIISREISAASSLGANVESEQALIKEEADNGGAIKCEGKKDKQGADNQLTNPNQSAVKSEPNHCQQESQQNVKGVNSVGICEQDKLKLETRVENDSLEQVSHVNRDGTGIVKDTVKGRRDDILSTGDRTDSTVDGKKRKLNDR
jgi:hypothetical protein